MNLASRRFLALALGQFLGSSHSASPPRRFLAGGQLLGSSHTLASSPRRFLAGGQLLGSSHSGSPPPRRLLLCPYLACIAGSKRETRDKINTILQADIMALD